jgi:hypothetical protein
MEGIYEYLGKEIIIRKGEIFFEIFETPSFETPKSGIIFKRNDIAITGMQSGKKIGQKRKFTKTVSSRKKCKI